MSGVRAAGGLLRGELCRLPRRLCRILPLLLLLAAVSAAAFFAVSTGAAQKEGALRLALVGDDDSFVGRTATAAVAGSPEIAALFTVESCDEATARAGLASGRYAAAMLFADDFIGGILDGDGDAVRIVLSDALQRNGALVAHAGATGEMLMRTAEAAVNAAWKPLAGALPAADAARAFEKLELRCAVEFFTLPSAAFAAETVPYSAAGLSLYAHFAVCFTVLLFFLAEALFAADIRESLTYAVLCRMRSLGVTGGGFLLGKCAIPFLCRMLLLCGIGTFAARAKLLTLTAGTAAAALFCLFSVSLFLTALSVAASSSPLGAALPCALGGVCLFLCGGLLPLHLLPPRVAALGAYTPFGAACDLLAPLFGGSLSRRTLCAAAVCTLLTAAAVAFGRRRFYRLLLRGGLTV